MPSKASPRCCGSDADGGDRGAELAASHPRARGKARCLSILSGAHLTLFPRVKKLLDQAGRSDILLTGGGIIPPEDVAALEQQGVGRLFGPGTPTSELVKYIEEWAAQRVSA